MIDEMLLFNRHDEINLDALKVIKEKKRYKMDKIKKHFNFQTLESGFEMFRIVFCSNLEKFRYSSGSAGEGRSDPLQFLN